MKRTVLILIPVFFTAAVCTAQTYDPDSGKIVIESEGGSSIMITEGDNFSPGFTISLGGYEVAFTGIEDLGDVQGKEKRKKKYRTRYDGRLSVVDFGFNALTSPDYKGYEGYQHGDDFLDLRNGRSIYVALNILQTSTALDRKGRFGFTTGIGLVWRNYSFENQLTLQKQNGTVFPVPLTTTNFKKSKLTTFAIDIPVIFEYNFHKFFVSAGGYMGLVVGSHTKYKAPKIKSRTGNAIEMFEYGLTARAGHRHFYAFGNYGLNGLFKTNKGPKTRTYTIGFGFPF